MSGQDAITRQWFKPETVKVVKEDSFTLGDAIDDASLVALSGAFSGSVLTVKQDAAQVHLKVEHYAVCEMRRRLIFLESGQHIVYNDKFRIWSRYGGNRLAARGLKIQASAAQRLGFHQLGLAAIGDWDSAINHKAEDRFNGYDLWPRLGFDAPIPSSVFSYLPTEFAGFKMVSELMATPEGQAAWKRWGTSLPEAIFDLTESSQSWQGLNKYLRERSIGV